MRDLILDTQDLTHLQWNERANTSGTVGTFLKARDARYRVTRYYKLSCYDSYRGVFGHECVNELIASRLLDYLGIPHVPYRLIRANVEVDGVRHLTWLSESENYRGHDEKKQALDLFYDLRREKGESPLAFCERYGWRRSIEQMILVDYLIVNRDRHGANVEVLRSADGAVRLAPLFDHGLSFVFSAYGDEGRAASFDPLADVNANNYIGTRSLRENLSFIREAVSVHSLNERAVDHILSDLTAVLPKTHLGKIKDILLARWAVAYEVGVIAERGGACD